MENSPTRPPYTRRRRTRPAQPALALATCIALLLTATAAASPEARLRVRFSPNQLGHSTNISFAIHIGAKHQPLPPPLTGIEIRFPRQLGFAISGLGLATCSTRTLELRGPSGCPRNSWMGQGHAYAEVPFGPETVGETATVSILRTTTTTDNIAMLFNVEAFQPVITNVILPGELQAGPGNFETIHVNVPLVETLPGASDVSVVQLAANIGPHNLVYYENIHGHRTPYHPKGILLPHKCPRRGFRFQTTLTFVNGDTTTSQAVIACPSPTAPVS